MSDGITDAQRTHWLNALDDSFIAVVHAMNRLGLWAYDEEFMKLAHKLASAAFVDSSPTAWEDHQRADCLSRRGLADWINPDYEEKNDESEKG